MHTRVGELATSFVLQVDWLDHLEQQAFAIIGVVTKDVANSPTLVCIAAWSRERCVPVDQFDDRMLACRSCGMT
jgi:hypothetical protein